MTDMCKISQTRSYQVLDGKDIPKFTSKSDILRWLKQQHESLSLALLPTQHVTIQQAIKDFRREKVVFNNVAFIPDTHDQYRCEMFELTLQEFSSRLLKISPNSCSEDYSKNPDKIAEIVLQNSCRTSAGSDSFFVLQDLFRVEGMILSQRAASEDPPIVIDLILDPEITDINQLAELKSMVKVWNFFSLYDGDVMDSCPTSDEYADPTPWLELETMIIETYNFKTNERSRRMELVATMPSSMLCDISSPS